MHSEASGGEGNHITGTHGANPANTGADNMASSPNYPSAVRQRRSVQVVVWIKGDARKCALL